jgi:tRNA pseudouridine32 synthase/23S rRNA pseudouridine746 synthase
MTFRKTISAEDPRNLCDALHHISGLSKIKIKEAMVKGAAWVERPGRKKRRVRRAKSAVTPGDVVLLNYDRKILDRKAPLATCRLDRTRYSIWHKPAGLMSQGSSFGDHCALPYQIERYFSPRRAVFPVHRLDREVSGLILIAHDKISASLLSGMLREHRIEKGYEAVVKGDLRPFPLPWEITLPLDNRPASTTFDVIYYDEDTDTTKAKIEIQTGRLHQIRRHFDLIGHPVMGDPRYGMNNSDPTGLNLSANFLSFDCPFDGDRISISIDP